jgi:hypothetical protein
MARQQNSDNQREDDLMKDVLSQAGMRSDHKSYAKKYKQIVRLELSEHECELLLELPEETLEYLFKGIRDLGIPLSKFDRRGLFEAMRVDWSAAIRALTDLEIGPEELVDLKQSLGNFGAVGKYLVDKGQID